MILQVCIDDRAHRLEVPEALLEQAAAFFAQLDRDMDRGWQLGRTWVEHPDREQRCRIVADKLLTAIEDGNTRLGLLMAGYLLDRLPELESVVLAPDGEIHDHRFNLLGAPSTETPVESETTTPALGLDKLAALARASEEVTTVFKVGRGYRFAVFDHASRAWRDGPLSATATEAAQLRERALEARYRALQRHQDD
ncbi:hypothetical protein [Marichromatium bheemlicum]|uniref:Uncharacterized protein n=1 Tax=Marichromatium bheemlicum TaxID=365339 RepID=A0ABX1IBW5_9GAMM|nr:hypothetical protein [Marichromatium bheemlicum]NKN33675.1 hypothetical protein [Marichromatium bheemlicum]